VRVPRAEGECVGLLETAAEKLSVTDTVWVTPVGKVVWLIVEVAAPDADIEVLGDTVLFVEPVLLTEVVEVLDCVVEEVVLAVLKPVTVAAPDLEAQTELVEVLEDAAEREEVTETEEVLDAELERVKEAVPVEDLLRSEELL